MVQVETYGALKALFRQGLENDPIELTPATTAEGWDSVNHIFMLVELEKRLGVKFQAAEMEELKNVGGLVTLVQQTPAKNK